MILMLAITTPASAADGGWMKKTEEDALTGKRVTFVRGYSGAGQGARNFDILQMDGAYYFRFVVPQVKNPVILHGRGYSALKLPQDLGDDLAWAVEGREPHRVKPEFSRRDAGFANNTDYRAQWAVGCEEIRELATGSILRVVTDNFTAEFTLVGFNPSIAKVFGISQSELIGREAEICKRHSETKDD
jgi:hypothetical protein